MHKSITDVMTTGVKTISPSATVQEGAQLMRSEDVGSLPIVENGRLVGVVTDRDIAIRVVAEGTGADTTVDQIASKEVVCVDPQQSLEEAARLMAQHQIRRLPVCEEDGTLVGILAQADLATAGHDTLTGETVEKISR